MPAKIIKLNATATPTEYYDTNKEELGVIPDGTGLQILFKVDNNYYLLAGPRTGKVLTVNGGTIENKNIPFLNQLQEEMFEETFGAIKLQFTDNGYQLVLNDGSTHSLTLLENNTFLKHNPGAYAYITFTAICETASLAQLQQLASTLTPTASFWNKIGNYLFSHVKSAPKDDGFSAYWQMQHQNRCDLITLLLKDYDLALKQNRMLIDPKDVFSTKTIEDALNTIHNVANYNALVKLFKHTVGRYSERASYHVLNAANVLTAAKTGCELCDVNGVRVATGVFNDDTVTTVLPLLNIRAHEFSPALSLGNLSAKAGIYGIPANLPAITKSTDLTQKQKFNF